MFYMEENILCLKKKRQNQIDSVSFKYAGCYNYFLLVIFFLSKFFFEM